MDVNSKIYKTLLELGVNPTYKGFRYLIHMIKKVLFGPEVMGPMMSLYAETAADLSSTPVRVERCIRSAIEHAVDICPMETMYEVFGNTISPNKGKPTNSLFVRRVADYIKSKEEQA